MTTASRLALLLTGALLLASPAQARKAADLEPDKEVQRDGLEYQADVRAAADRETDVADTALVFTNTGPEAVRVICRAIDGEGQAIGSRAGASVPAGGLRYIRASDLSDGEDFVGSAMCKASGAVLASGVFLAPGAVTDIPVHQREHRRHSRMRFPLVATY